MLCLDASLNSFSKPLVMLSLMVSISARVKSTVAANVAMAFSWDFILESNDEFCSGDLFIARTESSDFSGGGENKFGIF